MTYNPKTKKIRRAEVSGDVDPGRNVILMMLLNLFSSFYHFYWFWSSGFKTQLHSLRLQVFLKSFKQGWRVVDGDDYYFLFHCIISRGSAQGRNSLCGFCGLSHINSGQYQVILSNSGQLWGKIKNRGIFSPLKLHGQPDSPPELGR